VIRREEAVLQAMVFGHGGDGVKVACGKGRMPERGWGRERMGKR
jgi:hypothetical protein